MTAARSFTQRDEATLRTERGVLGGILLRNERMAQVNGLQPNHFLDPRHRAAFAAMQGLDARGQQIDTITMETELARQGSLQAIGGIAFLSELFDVQEIPDSIAHWAEAVETFGRERALRTDLGELVANVRIGPDELAARARRIANSYIGDVPETQGPMRPVRVANVVDEIIAESLLPYVPTGLMGIDYHLGGGFLARMMHVIVGGSGMGKTSLAVQIGAQHAEKSPAGYYSGELTRGQLAARIIAQRTNTPWRDVLRGSVHREVMLQVLLPLEFDIIRPCPNPIGAISASIDEMVSRNHGVPLMIVDYAQIVADMTTGDPRSSIMLAVQQLQALAESREVVILVLSQGNRGSARNMRGAWQQNGSDNPEDYMDAGAETSAIERAARTLIALVAAGKSEDGGKEVSAMIAKQTLGGACKAGLKFYGASGRWEDLGRAPVSMATKARQERVKTILDLVERGPGEYTKTELRGRAGGDTKSTGKLIDELVSDKKLAYVTRIRLLPDGRRKPYQVLDLSRQEEIVQNG